MPSIDPFYSMRKATWLDRLQALVEVMLLGGLFSSILASVPFSIRGTEEETLVRDATLVARFVLLEAFITLALLAIILRMNQQSPRDLGLHWNRWLSNVAWGIALIPALFSVNLLVSHGFKILLPKFHLQTNPLVELIRTPQELGLFLGAVLIAGGIKEELQRAFILNRFRDHLGGVRLGLILWSVAFGAGHYLQGLQGSVAAGLFGLLFGLLYLIRGSLVAPIVAHALYDVLALLGYWFLRGQG